ncbi:MAG TPA: DinB family protein [Anaerolineales bacterium]|nr:DinB family protein [Anaerolineales bacterium]
MPVTTLLFDLDDTLLGNDIRKFIPPYFQSFAAHIAPIADPKKFVGGLIAGTQAMMANADPRHTLQQTFGEMFYPSLGITDAQLQPYIDSFYVQKFPTLRRETHTIPMARETIQWAFDSGFKVVIATNALFPRAAILQRLNWAGVSADEFPYSLITTLEFMHFAKPNPEYYAEILSLVDSRPEETMMIGNDWAQDIAPAAQMGLHTFWIARPGTTAPENHAHPVGIGALADFFNWVRNAGLASLSPLPATARAVRAQLAASLATLLELTKDVPLELWSRRPREAEWSLAEIACHVRDVELEVNQPRFRKMIGESNPFISAIDSDPWAVERDYKSQPGPAALAAFAEARLETLSLLDRLTPDEWGRPARHAVFGPTTLLELLMITIVEHDRSHLRQIKENLNLQPPKSQVL